jgi:predicted CopG family antitoxin
VEPTPYSLRCASASGRGSPLALALISSRNSPTLPLTSSRAIILYVKQYVYNMGGAMMQKKLTITLDEKVYAGLHKVVGRRRISRFIEELVRPHVLDHDLETAYQQMAQDESREAEALEWAEATLRDVGDEPR